MVFQSDGFNKLKKKRCIPAQVPKFSLSNYLQSFAKGIYQIHRIGSLCLGKKYTVFTLTSSLFFLQRQSLLEEIRSFNVQDNSEKR